MKCKSFYRPLYDLVGVKWYCEREHDDARSWHQYTDDQGRRVQWSWTEAEKAARAR